MTFSAATPTAATPNAATPKTATSVAALTIPGARVVVTGAASGIGAALAGPDRWLASMNRLQQRLEDTIPVEGEL